MFLANSWIDVGISLNVCFRNKWGNKLRLGSAVSPSRWRFMRIYGKMKNNAFFHLDPLGWALCPYASEETDSLSYKLARLGVSEWASKQSEQSEQCGESEWMSDAGKWAIRRAGSPSLMSRFIVALNHRVCVEKWGIGRDESLFTSIIKTGLLCNVPALAGDLLEVVCRLKKKMMRK